MLNLLSSRFNSRTLFELVLKVMLKLIIK